MRLILLVLLGLSLIGCNFTNTKNAQDPPQSIHINPEQSEDHMAWAEIFEDVKYIPLETKEDHIIGKIDKLTVQEDLILILDKRISKSIFGFDHNGKFLFQIPVSGKGPGELSYIEDFAWDKYSSTIHVYDRLQRKVVQYGQNGDFIEENIIPYYFQHFSIPSEGLYACFSKDSNPSLVSGEELPPNRVLYISHTGKFINSFLPYEYKLENQPLGSFNTFSLYSSANSMVYYDGKVIYQIDGNGVQPAYYIDFGEYQLPEEKYIKTIDDFETSLAEGYAFGLNYFSEMPEYIYFHYSFKNKTPKRILFSKRSQKLKQFTNLNNIPNPFNGITNSGSLLGTTNDALIYKINATNLVSHTQQIKDENILDKFSDFQEIRKLSEQLSDSDNPVLLFYQIKDF